MVEKELTFDSVAFVQFLAERIWFIFISGIMAAIITLIVFFGKPNEYQSTSSVMPEMESSKAGGLSKFAGLASLAGLDLSAIESSDAVRPDLYPNIINNTSFFLHLLEQDVKTSGDYNENFLDFYIRNYDIEKDQNSFKLGFLNNLQRFLGVSQNMELKEDSLDGYIFLPKFKAKIIEELKEKVVAKMDRKTGIVSVSVELPDPVTAAHVAQISMDYLTNFVTDYRTEKARKDLNFLAKQLKEAKVKYYSTQSKKAVYNDDFQSSTIRLQAADIQRERIEADYRVSSTFYTELLKQYESAKMDLQKQTPVFKILEQPIIAYKKSGPDRLVFSFISLLIGFLTSIVVMLIYNSNYKKVIY